MCSPNSLTISNNGNRHRGVVLADEKFCHDGAFLILHSFFFSGMMKSSNLWKTDFFHLLSYMIPAFRQSINKIKKQAEGAFRFLLRKPAALLWIMEGRLRNQRCGLEFWKNESCKIRRP